MIYLFQDNDFFQAKFNCLIELNQANRGDLVRSPTREKLATFIETISKDTAGEFMGLLLSPAAFVHLSI